MAIIIQNMGACKGEGPMGLHNYELRINRRVLVKFTHRRDRGLVACLMTAAWEFTSQELMKTIKHLSALERKSKTSTKEKGHAAKKTSRHRRRAKSS